MADQKPLFKAPYDIKDVSALFTIVAFVLIIAAIFGIIAAFFLGLWGILYYPIKRAFKNKKKKMLSKNANQKGK